MKKITLKKIGILCVSMLFVAVSAGGAVSAEETTPIQPRGFGCEVCYTGYVAYMCRGVSVRSETGTHKYGLFWSDTCAVTYHYSYSDLVCVDCGAVFERAVGPHLCYEVHADCGLGHYNCCTVEYRPDN